MIYICNIYDIWYMIYICRRTGLFGPRHLIATQSFTLHRKQSSGNCQKYGYNQRYMKIWKQYILIQNFCWKISPPIYRSIPLDTPVPEFLHFVTHDSFGLTCRWSHLEQVITKYFSIENRFLMTVHLWENCNFVSEVWIFWQVYQFRSLLQLWNPIFLK